MAMMINNYYGCIGLRVGCLIYAYVKLVLTILITLFAIACVVYGNVLLNIKSTLHSDLHQAGFWLIIGASIITGFCLLQIAFTIVLLFGIHEEKRGHVKAYLMFAWLSIAIYIIGMVLCMHLFYVTIYLIFRNVVAIVVAVYHLLVIGSYSNKMKLDTEPTKGNDLP